MNRVPTTTEFREGSDLSGPGDPASCPIHHTLHPIHGIENSAGLHSPTVFIVGRRFTIQGKGELHRKEAGWFEAFDDNIQLLRQIRGDHVLSNQVRYREIKHTLWELIELPGQPSVSDNVLNSADGDRRNIQNVDDATPFYQFAGAKSQAYTDIQHGHSGNYPI